MASIKDFKKEINYIFGDVIDEANYKLLINPDVDGDKVDAIVDEAVTAYEDFYEKINAGRKAENKKDYYKTLTEEVTQTVKDLMTKIEAL